MQLACWSLISSQAEKNGSKLGILHSTVTAKASNPQLNMHMVSFCFNTASPISPCDIPNTIAMLNGRPTKPKDA